MGARRLAPTKCRGEIGSGGSAPPLQGSLSQRVIRGPDDVGKQLVHITTIEAQVYTRYAGGSVKESVKCKSNFKSADVSIIANGWSAIASGHQVVARAAVRSSSACKSRN